jgi:hypothetical protein
MTGTNCDLFTHKSSRSYLNHLVHGSLGSGQQSVQEITWVMSVKAKLTS